jgi:cytochrome c2
MKRIAVLLLLLAACKRYEKAQIAQQTGGDAARGKQLVQQYGCTSCHQIPRVSGPQGMVGPPLTHIASRQYIGGKLPNTPENMSKWLQDPQGVDPSNAMPNLGLTVDQSRDITSFLYTLK